VLTYLLQKDQAKINPAPREKVRFKKKPETRRNVDSFPLKSFLPKFIPHSMMDEIFFYFYGTITLGASRKNMLSFGELIRVVT
jgi:hypothetical protein